MNFPLFIARRIHASGNGRLRVSRPAVTIATAGVAIGLAVMIVSVAVVFGFKHTIRNKIVGFGTDIQVSNFMSQMSSVQYPVVTSDSMIKAVEHIPGVAHVQRFAYKQGILKTDSDFLGLVFKGIGPEYDTTFLAKQLVEGSIPKFSDQASHNKILISKWMSKTLKVKLGDRIFAYFIDSNGVRIRRFTIAGIYETNLNQFDKAIAFTDLYTAVKLNGWYPDQSSGLEVSLRDFNQLDQVEDLFIKKVNRTTDHYGETYTTQTIIEQNPQIFSWLDLLDLNVWIILALMVSVASVTMISGLLIIILERTSMIGLLKALGARNQTIRHIFLWLAFFIIGRGMIIGDLLALALLFIQKWTGIVKLDPEVYYVSSVPVEINVVAFVLVNAFTLLICLFILLAPSYLVSHIHPSRSMRYE